MPAKPRRLSLYQQQRLNEESETNAADQLTICYLRLPLDDCHIPGLSIPADPNAGQLVLIGTIVPTSFPFWSCVRRCDKCFYGEKNTACMPLSPTSFACCAGLHSAGTVIGESCLVCSTFVKSSSPWSSLEGRGTTQSSSEVYNTIVVIASRVHSNHPLLEAAHHYPTWCCPL